MKRFYRQLAINMLIALSVFVVSLIIHEGPLTEEIKTFGLPALCYYGFHFFISLANRKYEDGNRYSLKKISRLYILSWLYSSGLALLVIFIFRLDDFFPRQIVLTNIFGLLAGESVMVFIISLFRESVTIREPEDITEVGAKDLETLYPVKEAEKTLQDKKHGLSDFQKEGKEAIEFASAYFDLTSDACQILETSDQSAILGFPAGKYSQIINFHNLNRIPNINQFLEAANSRLPNGGLLMVCGETTEQRRTRIIHKYPPVLNQWYYLGDYMLMRVFPKLPPGEKIYFALTKGQSRVLSRPEILGRLISCGFEIVAEKKNTIRSYVIARKVRLPATHNYATYGPLIRLNRIGKDGKMIRIYKLRTMHPYSEYIQEYVYGQNNLASGGKIRNDFRITGPGRYLRRFWIDELPSLWNWMRGDVKIVGVRPLSRHYFSLYTTELQQKRIRFKPGLIPPYYADMPKTLVEIMDSELRYLEQYEKAPLKTDWEYFLKSVYNIVLKGAKSN